MRRAIRLAVNGRGRAEPNPLVGCVIVGPDGRVIGEGYHQRYGQAHAEPNALASCTESPAGATAHVTLEPCCHANKQTPPCAPRLIAARVARVVVGCTDPNPAVDGKGVAMLRQAGIVVDRSAVEAECRQLIAPFVARVCHGRPYVTIKWAQTADGKVAGPGGRRLQIGNARSARLVHELRARSDAILVGVRTVLADDPLLTARGVENPRPLSRFVLDRDLDLPETSRLVATAGLQSLYVICSPAAVRRKPGKAATLVASGVRLIELDELNGNRFDLGAVLRAIGRALPAANHLLIEPGPGLAVAFIGDGAWDRAWVFRSPVALNDARAPAAPPFAPPETGRLELDGDVLTEYLNPGSATFAANVPSADFVLAGG
jgi:diaminohydroxyphosphoribosylaminopyrimidine deaminase/5-amino-6-(5-phosphoribosylamino)uracil reductase